MPGLTTAKFRNGWWWKCAGRTARASAVKNGDGGPVERNTGRFASYIAWNQEGKPVSKGGLKTLQDGCLAGKKGHSVTRRRKICCHKEDCLVLMKKHYHDDIAPSFTAPACIYGWGDKKDRSVRTLPSSRNWVCSLMELWPNGRGSNLIIPLY